MDTKNKKTNLICGILLAITAVIFYLANHYAEFEMDDLWYATNLVTGEPLNSIKDVWQSQVWHFFNWGGRSIAHGQLQILLMWGETAANIANMLALTALIFLILKHANVVKTTLPQLSLAIAGFLIIFNINWYQTLFWESGACNYLYMTTWILLFMYPYMKSLQNINGSLENSHNNKPKLIEAWILPLGLIAGWSNENMGPTAFLATLAIIIITKKKTNKLIPWQIEGAITSLIGSALCILAPGNSVRVVEAASTDTSKSLLWRAFIRCYETTNGLLYYLAIPLMTLGILAFIYVAVLGKKIELIQILFICMAIVSWGAMILSPHYPDRASFGSMIFMLTPVIYLLSRILEESKIKEVYSTLLCILIWLIGIFRPIVYICQQLGWIKL
ncbi:hypothetical protein SAMN02910368_02762 [Lachnospiraceae bacterium G11]|nr:hypothetical protein SAMN02910368_02762 [Lachnospiraceae bacterium G11]